MTRWQQIRLLVVIGLLTITSAVTITGINTTVTVYSSSIEVPTYDPFMSHDAKVNGTKALDYTGSEDMAFLMSPWYNYTVMVDVSDYNDCLAKVKGDLVSVEKLTTLTNNATEAQRVISLPPDEQKAYAMDHCLSVLYISNVMEKAFSDAFSQQ